MIFTNPKALFFELEFWNLEFWNLEFGIYGRFRRGGSGYSLQVLALPSSGCGLFTSIPNAHMQQLFDK